MLFPAQDFLPPGALADLFMNLLFSLVFISIHLVLLPSWQWVLLCGWHNSSLGSDLTAEA